MDDVRDVPDDTDGPGVLGGDEGGGGVTEIERCIVEIWTTGRAIQNADVVGCGRGVGVERLAVVVETADALALVLATGGAFSTCLGTGLAFFLICSRSFLFSWRRARR